MMICGAVCFAGLPSVDGLKNRLCDKFTSFATRGLNVCVSITARLWLFNVTVLGILPPLASSPPPPNLSKKRLRLTFATKLRRSEANVNRNLFLDKFGGGGLL